MKKYKVLLLSLFLSSISTTYATATTDIVIPKIEYYPDTPRIDAQDEATVSAIQFVSGNDLAKSYMRFSLEETKGRDWAQTANSKTTLVDFRQWHSSPFTNMQNVVAVNSENGSLNNSRLIANEEMVRSLNVLGSSAFIPENVDFTESKESSYIHEIYAEKHTSRTEALVTLYKAVGNEHFLPPIISYRNLDNSPSGGRVAIKDTSLNSLESAVPYLYYAVDIDNTRQVVYQSNNLIEGYLWDAIQDGIILPSDLTTEGRISVLQNYKSGVYSKVLTPLSNSYSSEGEYQITIDDPTNMLGHKIIVKEDGKSLGVRYSTPNALNNESVTLIEFLSLSRQVMFARGEEVLSQDEMIKLTKAHGRVIPTNISDEYYDAILYNISRGIIDDSMLSRLYDPLTWGDAFTIASRIKDKSSRLNYKYLEIQATDNLIGDDYIAASLSPTDAEIFNVDSKVNTIRYNIYLPAVFYDEATNKIQFPSFTEGVNEIGMVDKDIYYDKYNNPFYKLSISTLDTLPEKYESQIISSDNITYRNPNPAKVINGKVNGNEILMENFITKFPSGDILMYWDNFSNTYKVKEVAIPDGFTREANNMKYIPTAALQPGEQAPKVDNNTYALVEFKTLLKPNEDFTLRGYTDYRETSLINTSSLSPTANKDGIYVKTVNYVPEVVTNADGTQTTVYRVLMYLPITEKGDYEAAINNLMVLTKPNASSDAAYVRRVDTNDVYLPNTQLKSLLGIDTSFDELDITLTKDTTTIKISPISGGWIVYNTDGALMSFSDKLPPVKIQNDNSDVAGYIHISVVNYLLSNTKMNISPYLSSQGYIHLGNNKSGLFAEYGVTVATDWKMKKLDGVQVTPLLGTESSEISNLLYTRYDRRNQAKETYIDLQAIPPEHRNYIFIWKIEGPAREQVTLDLAYVHPQMKEATYDVKEFVNTVNHYGLDMDKSELENFGVSRISVPDFSKLSKEYLEKNKLYISKNSNTGFRQTNQVLFDPVTFNIYLKANSIENLTPIWETDTDKIPALPYYTQDTSRVVFANLPMIDGKVPEEDIKSSGGSLLNPNIPVSLETDSSPKGTRSWYPTGLLNTHTTPTKDLEGYKVWVGPYFLSLKEFKIANGGTQEAKLYNTQLFEYLPKWSKSLLGTDSSEYLINSTKTTEVPIIGNTILPIKFTSTNLNEDKSKVKELGGVSSSEISGDNVNNLLLNQEKLQRTFNDINDWVSFFDIVITNILPRFLLMTLILYQVLALNARSPLMNWLCNHGIDVFRLITFRRFSRDEIVPIKLWIIGTIACVLLVIISRRELHNILIWIISNF